jgi:exodeoxyribonuclease V beta subunit
MSEIIKTFDAASAPLNRGVNVVEASAGTGKTYAIAMLVLRFVVEFGVAVEELLVVSYTRAATEELRSRIRKRLLEARGLLADRQKGSEDSALLLYLAALPDKALAIARLEVALLDMDRAAVYTIHGFCQRMLQEQALESGQLFDMELTADISEIQSELVADYWRTRMYDLPGFHCSLFLSRFSDPEALYKTVKGVGAEDLIFPDERGSVADALLEVDAALEALVHWWQETSVSLEGCFREGLEQGMFKKGFAGDFEYWWQQCGQFFSGAEQRLPPGLALLGHSTLVGELNGTKLRGEAKKTAFLEDFPLAEEIIDIFLTACNRAILSLRIQLALELQTGLRERLLRKGHFSFDDLVVSLARALDGPRKKDLQRVLASRFQVALIDEFQDTDSAQYRIFSSLFGSREKKHFLFLIGDPKQAIYKFRGADIAAYFQARESADYLLGLGRNYRSNPQLVAAVNDLFLQRDDAFVSPELSYFAVDAAKSPDCWQLWQNDRVQAAMVYCSVESPDEDGAKPWTSGKIRARLESYVVAEIRDLLHNASLATDTGEKKQVAAGDIAILVRSNKQAESFQESLALARIPSVVLSRKTVFETAECCDLLLVAEAVASPSDIRLLRSALSSKWFGLDGPALYEQLQDERIMEAWMERFHEYHHLWQEKGFLAMMNSLFVRESVFETLCALPLAERQISNIQHLVELLQEKESRENLHLFHTLQYLSAQMESAESHEHAQLRLESDEQAVKVVTMHAVKGLEYPIVFCPYLWNRTGFLKQEKDCVSYHDEQNNRVSDLGSADFEERREAALIEELAEEARLLYVAVTRASSRCYVFWADVRGDRFAMSSRDSALAWVLSLKDCQDIQGQTARLEALCGKDSVALQSVSASIEEREWQGPESVEQATLTCRTFSRPSLPGEWLMTSYSALAGAGHGAAGYTPVVPGEELEGKSVKIHSLPLGAGLGNVVHGLLEDFPFTMLAGKADYEEECQAQCNRFGVTASSDQLMNLLRDVTTAPLGNEHGGELFVLAGLDDQDVLKEMPFYFHLREGSTERINELLHFSNVVQPIQERKLKGYLTGFIDLVCRHQGKYYVMDYKTNYLGTHFSDYSSDMLVSAMHDHNYGLQYWIYTLVLHRFLMATLPKYDYEQDFGGVFYLFARGMSPKYPGNGLFFDRPQLSVLDELYKCLGA